MITDRELDAQLAAAAGVHDRDLPPLPADFLRVLRSIDDGADAAGREPASVLAARQLVADAHERRTSGRRRPRTRLSRRRTALRIGAGVAVAAVAWTLAVVVGGPDAGRDPVAPPDSGITLVAAEEVTFPLSLDPVPDGLRPVFTGGRDWATDGAIADYRSADPATHVTLSVFAEKPAWLQDPLGEPDDVAETGTVAVGGAAAEFARGINTACYPTDCDRPFAQLVWQRAPGQWVVLRGEGGYGDPARLVAVGESLVDRPQPVTLQVQLAPAGWSVADYHDSQAISYVSDDDPDQSMTVQVFAPEPGRGPAGGWSPDQLIAIASADGPPTPVTVHHRPARLVTCDDCSIPQGRHTWYLQAQFADGTLFVLQAPDDLTQDQVLAIAEQVTYTR
jgi:hypothetical protein